jgi:hypothetical protein
MPITVTSCYGGNNMEMSPSEIVDRWSIVRMKCRYDDSLLPLYLQLDAEVRKFFVWDIMHIITNLVEANAKIWVLEASTRNMYKKDPSNTGVQVSAEEVGRVTLQIREHNDLRLKNKDAIDRYFGAIPDKKFDHRSDELLVEEKK